MTMLAVSAQNDLEEAAAQRVREISVMGPDDRLLELAKLYVLVDRIAPVIDSATLATGMAEQAVEVGGSLIGGTGACDCVIMQPVRTCPYSVAFVSGNPPTLPPGDPQLKSARHHARTIEKLLRGRLRVYEKLAVNHMSASKILKAIGL